MKRILALITLFVFGVACLAQQTTTPNINLALPNYHSNNWNIPLNYNFTQLDRFLSGNQSIPGLNIQGNEQVSGTATIGQGIFNSAKITSLINAGCLGTDSLGNITVGTCSSSGGGTLMQINGATQTSVNFNSLIPQNCPDTSGSTTAKSCVTSTTFTPALNNCVIFYSTTTNSTTSATLSVNGVTASIAVPGPSGYTSTLVASMLPSFTPMMACYNMTYWEIQQTGVLPSGSGSTIEVEGTSQSTGNFNHTTPAAPSGNTNVTFQTDGTHISGYVPTASGGSGPLASNSQIVWLGGTSGIDDDGGLLAPNIAVTSCTVSGSTTTVNTSAATNFSTGHWINTRHITGWPTPPSPFVLGTGYTLFQVQSTPTSTSFTINTSLISVSSCSGGYVESADNNLPFRTALQRGMPANAYNNTYVYLPTDSGITGGAPSVAATAAHFSALVANVPTGVPTYFTFVDTNNDVETCRTATQTEGDLETLMADVHTWGGFFVAVSAGAVSISQSLTCGSGTYATWYLDQKWLQTMGPGNALAEVPATASEYWDMFSDAGNTYNDAFDSSVGGGLFGGWDRKASRIATDLLTGGGVPTEQAQSYFMGLPVNANTAINGRAWHATGDTAASFIWFSSTGTADMWLDTFNHTLNVNQFCVNSVVSNVTHNAFSCPLTTPFGFSGGISYGTEYEVNGAGGSTSYPWAGNFCFDGGGSLPSCPLFLYAPDTSHLHVHGTFIPDNGISAASGGSTGNCWNTDGTTTSCGGSGGGWNGTVTYISSQTASTSDNMKLVIMNCSSCTYTLPATQPSTTFVVWVQAVGSPLPTIVLGGSDTYNGVATAPLLNEYDTCLIAANTAISTDYRGCTPVVAGSGVTVTPATNGKSIAASGGLSPIFGSADPTGAGGTPTYNQQTNGQVGGSGSLTAAFGSNVTSGDAIVILVNSASSGTPTVSDTLGTSFTSYLSQTTQSPTYVYCGIAPSTGADTITISSWANSAAYVYDVSGMLCTVDATGSLATGTTSVTSTVTTVALNDALFSFVNNQTTNAKASSISSPFNASGGGIHQEYTFNTAYSIASTATTYSAAWSIPASSSDNESSQTIAFEAGGSPVSGTEGQTYYQTSATPYVLWVYHSSAWHQVQ